MTASERELIEFMTGFVDADVGTKTTDHPDIVDEAGVLRADVVPRLRALLRSGRIDADAWFDRLFPALMATSSDSIRAMSAGAAELPASGSTDHQAVGCDLVIALADLAGSQAERAREVLANRDDYDSLLVQAALTILAKTRGGGPGGYERVKHELVTAKCYANREGKAIAGLAGHVPGEIDRLFGALKRGTDRRLQDFAIDVLEEYPGRAADILPRLESLVVDGATHAVTRMLAMSALAKLGAACDRETEKGVVEFMKRQVDSPEPGIRAGVYDAFGVVRRHATLTLPTLLEGLCDEGDCHDFLACEVALDALGRYAFAPPPEVEPILAADVRARTRLWEQGRDPDFFDEYFEMLAKIAQGPGPVLDALRALESGERDARDIDGYDRMKRAIAFMDRENRGERP